MPNRMYRECCAVLLYAHSYTHLQTFVCIDILLQKKYGGHIEHKHIETVMHSAYLPSIVKVFPVPVWPYAKMVPEECNREGDSARAQNTASRPKIK